MANRGIGELGIGESGNRGIGELGNPGTRELRNERIGESENWGIEDLSISVLSRH